MKLLSLIETLIIVLSFNCSNGKFQSAEEVFTEGQRLIQAGLRQEAFACFEKAADKDQNPRYSWAAAKTAPSRSVALVFAWRAWQNGLKNREVLFFLVNIYQTAKNENRIKYGLTLLDELPDSFDKELIKGEIYLHSNFPDSALAIWEKSYKESPRVSIVNSIGRMFVLVDNYKRASAFLENASRKNHLDSRGYSIYGLVRAQMGDFAGADRIFNKARKTGLYSNKMRIEHAWISFLNSNRLEAIEILLDADNPDQQLTTERDFLLSFFYRIGNDTTNLRALVTTFSGRPDEISLRQFANTLILCIRGDSNALNKLESVYEKSDKNAALEFARIHENIKLNSSRSLESFKNLPQFLIRIPTVEIMYANLLADHGNSEEAEKILISLSRRDIVNRATLELQQRIYVRQKRVTKSLAIQQMLEKSFPQDISLKVNGAMLVIRAGKLDSALHVLDKLQVKYPNEKGVFIAKIHALYLKKDYERVINLIDRDVHFQDVLLPIKAQSLVKSNRFTEADSLYKFLISKTTDTDILIGYAELLVSQGNFLRAFEMYEKIVDAFRTQSNDSTILAISLNNAAWAQMRSGKGSISTALKMSEKAYHLYSDEPRIIDTYTELLIKSKNVSKAIDVLHKSIESRNPLLLVRLADAYKINGQKRKAESLYRELLNLNDSILSVYSLSKESLNRKISR